MFSSNVPPPHNVHNVESLLLVRAPHRSAVSVFLGVLEGALLGGEQKNVSIALTAALMIYERLT
jgi:hypothetical protein